MKDIIQNWLAYKTLISSIQEKKNKILDCIPLVEKSLNSDKERIKLKQKKIAFSLKKDLKQEKRKRKELKTLISKSFQKSSFIADCLDNNIDKNSLKILKECLSYFKK